MLNKFDQRLIDFLTMICWWTEVKWEKNNLHWAYQTNILSHMFWFFTGTFVLIQILEKGNYFWILFVSFILSVVGFTLFIKIVFSDKIMRFVYIPMFPQGSPNPCRISHKHISDRKELIFLFFVFCLGYYLDDFSKFVISELMWSISCFLALIFGFFFEYLMACDSIPPEEKVKRKAKVDMWNGNLQPVQISAN